MYNNCLDFDYARSRSINYPTTIKIKVVKVIQSWPTLLPNVVSKIVYCISPSVNNLICLFVEDLKFSKHKD